MKGIQLDKSERVFYLNSTKKLYNCRSLVVTMKILKKLQNRPYEWIYVVLLLFCSSSEEKMKIEVITYMYGKECHIRVPHTAIIDHNKCFYLFRIRNSYSMNTNTLTVAKRYSYIDELTFETGSSICSQFESRFASTSISILTNLTAKMLAHRFVFFVTRMRN